MHPDKDRRAKLPKSEISGKNAFTSQEEVRLLQ